MRLLLLGGPKFVGRAVIDVALARGHEVTLFNRGTTGAGLYPELDRVVGDRDGGLEGLRGREWDAVVDTSGYLPRVVGQSAGLLADAVGHYVFVSSISVYASFAEVVDEGSELAALSAPGSEDISADYGALKALCERTLEDELPRRTLSVRAGLIVGPYDNTGRFTYWVHRIARGGEVLAPEPRDQPVQFVHARDLADWMLASAERRLAGVFNATGPDTLLTLGELLDACKELAETPVTLRWADEHFLVEQGVEEWSDLPLWVAPGVKEENAGLMSVDVSRALAEGLRFRPLPQTLRETLAAARPTADAGLTPEREQELLAA